MFKTSLKFDLFSNCLKNNVTYFFNTITYKMLSIIFPKENGALKCEIFVYIVVEHDKVNK